MKLLVLMISIVLLALQASSAAERQMHLNDFRILNLHSTAAIPNISRLVQKDNYKIVPCLRRQGQLELSLTTLRIDSTDWEIHNVINTSFSCTLKLISRENTTLHVALWRKGDMSKCSDNNYVILRDGGSSLNTTDCGLNFTMYTTSANILEMMIIVADQSSLFSMTISVQAADAVFELRYYTANMGFIQTPFYDSERPFSPRMDSWLTMSVPLHHVTLVSIMKLHLRWVNSPNYKPGTVRLYLEENDSKTQVWKIRKTNLPLPEVFEARMLHLRFTGWISYLWFRLLYSYHEKSYQPSRVRGNLWNCSVSEWSEFQRHFQCNLDRECEGGEDEAQCVYVGHCGQYHLTLNDRCYLYVLGKRISWRDSTVECQKLGGYLASLNTPDEWQPVAYTLKMRRTHRKVFIGLHDTPSVLPLIYKNTKMWVDKTMAYTFEMKKFRKNRCGYFNSFSHLVRQDIACDVDVRSVDFLCEFDWHSKDLGGDNDTQVLIHRPIPRNASVKVPVVKCPESHLTHTFLACDTQSACWSNRHGYGNPESLGVPSKVSCPIPMTSLPAMFMCNSRTQRVPYSFVCDHRQQCADNSDEDFCVFPPCSLSASIQCATSKQCVPLSALCNRQGDCKLNTEEAQCFDSFPSSVRPPAIVHFSSFRIAYFMRMLEAECPETHVQCPGQGYCLPVFIMCNGVSDCPDREDEVGCDRPSCPGLYRCRGSKVCLHPSHVCDGMYQCPQHDDEILCRLTCPLGCTCYGLDFTCRQHFKAEHHPEVRYLDADNSSLKPESLTAQKLLIYLSLSNCGVESIHKMALPNLRSLDLSHNELHIISAIHLRGMMNLQFLSLSRNPLTSLFSEKSGLLSFPALKTLDVSGAKMHKMNTRSFSVFPGLQILNLSHCDIDEITDDGLHATKKLQVLDIVGCSMTIFPRDLLSELNELQTVEADNFKLCCQDTLPVGFNLANCRAPFDEVSSCESLLRSDIYLVFLSMFAGTGLLGNLLCFLMRVFSSKSSNSGFSVFVTHLSISDFLMGAYLAIIGVADRLYKGSYLWEDIWWRHSAACKVAGVLSLMSNEVSAFIICLITLDRFLVLRFPFSSLHFNVRSAHITCALVWVGGVVMSAVPLLPSTSHWSFFSQTGICIPLPVTRRDFPGRLYSFSVLIVFNFILFILIAVGQAIIYVSIKTNSLSRSDSTKKSTDLRIASRLISVAVSDFLCWFPIGLLGLLASRGVPISGEVNVSMAIMVLPLNSALNPFLYTINIMLERRRRLQDEKIFKQLLAELCNDGES